MYTIWHLSERDRGPTTSLGLNLNYSSRSAHIVLDILMAAELPIPVFTSLNDLYQNLGTTVNHA